MKKLISVTLVLMMVLTSVFVISTSAAEADTIVHSLLPAADESNGKVTVNNCEYTCNADGSVTFTVTGAGASVNVVYAEGATVWAGDAFNVREGAYVVFDYGSADGATLGQSTQAHYTRKDKEANGTVADLWLTSMQTMTNYQKASGEGYGIWSLGDYLVTEKGDAGIFEDNMHRFTSLELYIEGPVGSSVTVYRFYVGTADSVEGLGSVRPEAKVPEVSEPDESEPAVEIEIPEGAVNLGRVPVNTSIVAGSTTIVSDPSIMHNYNVKWTSCALLRPTENENEYSVVAVQWLNGDDSFAFADAQTGDIVLSVHGDETVAGSQDNRNALDTLVAGDIVTLIGYDFEKLTAADDAVVFFVPNTAEQPDDSSEPSDESDPVDESEPADESKPADESTPVVDNSEAAGEEDGGNTGLIIGIVAAVVAVVAIVVVIVIVKKKK